MIFIAFIWAILAAAAMSTGLERSSNLEKVFNTSVNPVLPHFLFMTGIASSFAVIFGSFYYFVTRNAVFVLVAWLLVFALLRFIIEIMLRSGSYGGEGASRPYVDSSYKEPANRAHAAAPAEVGHDAAAHGDANDQAYRPSGQGSVYDQIFSRVNQHAADDAGKKGDKK